MKFILNENKKFILEERFILKESEILTEDKTPAEKLVLVVGNLERWVPSILEALPKVQTLELDDNLKALCADVLKTLEKANLKYLIAELKENAPLYQADIIGKERHKGILGLIGDKLTGDFQSIVTNIETIQKSTPPVNYTLEKLQQKLNDVKTHVAELQKWMEENEPVKSTSSDEDWAAKYNAAVNKDAVWEEYINTVWENDFDKIIKLKKDVDNKISKIGKKAVNGQRLIELLYSEPKVNSKTVSEKLGISVVSANGLLSTFVEIGILEEKTGFNRNRYYVFEEYVKIFR